MKNYLVVLVSIFTLGLTSVANAQDEKTSQVIYNGYNGEAYTFTTVAENPEDAKTLSFTDISDDVLAQFDLKSDAFKGETFTVMYTVAIENLEAPDGTNEEVETFTLVGLKK